MWNLLTRVSAIICGDRLRRHHHANRRHSCRPSCASRRSCLAMCRSCCDCSTNCCGCRRSCASSMNCCGRSPTNCSTSTNCCGRSPMCCSTSMCCCGCSRCEESTTKRMWNSRGCCWRSCWYGCLTTTRRRESTSCCPKPTMKCRSDDCCSCRSDGCRRWKHLYRCSNSTNCLWHHNYPKWWCNRDDCR